MTHATSTTSPLTKGAALIDLLRVGLVGPEPKPFIADAGLFERTDACFACHGDGEITVNTSRIRDPQEDRQERCPSCHGTGAA